MNPRHTPFCAALVAAASLWAAAPVYARSLPLIVISSHETLPYREALAELRRLAAEAQIELRTTSPGADGRLPPALQRELADGSALAVALGARARDALPPRAHALVCLALDAGGHPGVLLAQPAEARVEWVRRLLPQARSLGVLHVAGETREEVAALDRAARRAGLETVAHAIDLRYPLAEQLERIANTIDVLVGTHDLRIYSADNAPRLLFFSYQHHIPIIGPSDAWARAGALLSLDWDYADIGRQCGEIAVRAAQQHALPRTGAVPARTLTYAINRRAARYFRVEFSAEIARGARQLFD